MFSIESVPDSYKDTIMSALVPLVFLTGAIDGLSGKEMRRPGSIGRLTLRKFISGIDSVVATMRLLLCGQIAGAAIIARNQIETWTEARAALTDTTKQRSESHADFVARTWSRPISRSHASAGTASRVFDDPEQYVSVVEPDVEHTHIRLSTGEELCPAGIWGLLSEVLHGREGTAVSAWDAYCLDPAQLGESEAVLGLVLDALRVGMFQIRGEIRLLAIDGDIPMIDELLRQTAEEFSVAADDDGANPPAPGALPPSSHFVSPPLSFMAPLSPGEGLSPAAVGQLADAAKAFELVKQGRRPAGRLYRDDELMTTVFGWHRFRSARAAQEALDIEERLLPDEFDERVLQHRSTIWAFVTEATALVGLWQSPGPSRDAALLAASTLRSAWWLWLEDDDRAMSILRTVLEQTARLRVWRLKPEKALKLESRSTPRDWIEAAGWKRLAPLNSALGEFAHVTSRSDWNAARLVLTDIQDSPERDDAPFTARRSSLELVTSLLAIEVCEQNQALSPSIADALRELFHEVGAFPQDEARFVEDRLRAIHAYQTRSTDQGSKS
ncbi:hypothetical protein [Microbacterium hominis]|uniref:Uncharacterized protein n=1 Tax=Microbacterium hominis TaxID=162426 RepID=A0A7D4PZ41_9MICO|nr:hypothetical protein [Microbacterium hominis]QKJ18052.1 hypothetical protein HQM25_00550 [Microbacterium hominis]